MKLNLGCNTDIKDGYINIDIYPYNERVVVGDCRSLDFVNSGDVDEIYAQDILEHLPFNDGVDAIKLWCSLLRKDGTIFIQTTDVDLHIECFKHKCGDLKNFNYMMFAGVAWGKDKINEYDFHKSIWSSDFIESLFNDNGVVVTSIKKNDLDYNKSYSCGQNFNMFIWGKKIK